MLKELEQPHNINILQGKFLLSTLEINDPFFRNSLIYICEHNPKGAFGIIINHPIKMSFDELCQQVGIKNQNLKFANIQIYYGGPINSDQGMVLHQPLGNWQATTIIDDQIGITNSIDIIESMSTKKDHEQKPSPIQSMILLGYAGWDVGQLENEISNNYWLIVDADKSIIFNTPVEKRLDKAYAQIGINKANFISHAGHA